MNEPFYFSDGENVKNIPIELLEQSLMIRDNTGRAPKARPIQSWELIRFIMETAIRAGVEPEIRSIYVPKSSANPVINQSEKDIYSSGTNIPINKWLFNKVAFLIYLRKGKGREDMTTSMAASYHPNGLQLALGQHISLCQNMCIFGANTMYSYGEEKMPYIKMMEVLQNWFANFDVKVEEDLAIIEQMKNIIFDVDEIESFFNTIIGKMYRMAIRGAYMKTKESLFDTQECSRFVQNLEAKLMSYKDQEGKLINGVAMWDIYNWGTEILKPETTDVAYVYQTISDWGKFLTQQVHLIQKIVLVDGKITIDVPSETMPTSAPEPKVKGHKNVNN